jgi:hypothetical protein
MPIPTDTEPRMITCDDQSEAIRAAAEYQAKIDAEPMLVGKWRVEASDFDPINQNYCLKAIPLWDHGWQLLELLNMPFDKPRKRKYR